MYCYNTVKATTSFLQTKETFSVILFISRTLGTPNNEVWPDVESLPDYKNTFPKWKSGNLANTVKNLDKNGIDLLMVKGRPNVLVSYLSVWFCLSFSPHIFISVSFV